MTDNVMDVAGEGTSSTPAQPAGNTNITVKGQLKANVNFWEKILNANTDIFYHFIPPLHVAI